MARERISFFCSSCGHETGKWLGRCPGCGCWNTFREAPVKPRSTRESSLPIGQPPALLIGAVTTQDRRLPTHSVEMDRVLGGGIVPGSVILLGGDPGIGKSTLLLQLAAAVGEGSGIVLYVSGEESHQQVQMRAQRLGIGCEHLYFSNEADLDRIKGALGSVDPVLVIIDSIQTMSHPDLPLLPGSIGQLRECTAELVRLAKLKNFSCFLIGHVTKEGSLAGPRVLEHMVDTVLSFEGERHQNFRLLRAVKNRFGATNEIAVFTMGEQGLEEVANPSALFLDGRAADIPGSVVVAALEGTRPVLVEIQALVCPTVFGSPRRATTGVDYNRVVLTAAVLEKRVGLNLANQDVYVSVVGGLKVVEPAVDLGVALALASNFRNIPVDAGTVVMGEIGLTGEVRACGQVEQRIREAVRLGFRRFIIPERNLEVRERYPDLELIGVKTVREALDRSL